MQGILFLSQPAGKFICSSTGKADLEFDSNSTELRPEEGSTRSFSSSAGLNAGYWKQDPSTTILGVEASLFLRCIYTLCEEKTYTDWSSRSQAPMALSSVKSS